MSKLKTEKLSYKQKGPKNQEGTATPCSQCLCLQERLRLGKQSARPGLESWALLYAWPRCWVILPKFLTHHSSHLKNGSNIPAPSTSWDLSEAQRNQPREQEESLEASRRCSCPALRYDIRAKPPAAFPPPPQALLAAPALSFPGDSSQPPPIPLTLQLCMALCSPFSQELLCLSSGPQPQSRTEHVTWSTRHPHLILMPASILSPSCPKALAGALAWARRMLLYLPSNSNHHLLQVTAHSQLASV